MNTEFENELRTMKLRPIPEEWRTRILAKAMPTKRQTAWSAFLWPHPGLWAAVAMAWLAVAILGFTGPRGKDLYAFGPEGGDRIRISPEAYALYIARCAEFDLKRPAQIIPLRRSEL